MRKTHFLLVAAVYVATALTAYAISVAMGRERHGDLALLMATLVASHAGALIWHYRRVPGATVRSVKLGLGIVLSVTAVAFAVTFQAISGWLEMPEVSVPMAAIGGFLFGFQVVVPHSKAKSTDKPPEGRDADPGDDRADV